MKPFKTFLASIRINKIVQFLTYSDILMLGGWGLVNPILAIFVSGQIVGGDVAIAGLALTTYFLTKSILQIPIARYVDVTKGEWDDFLVMVIGSLLATATAFLFIFARYPWHVYMIQILHGLGSALSYPAWMAIFTRHVDKSQEGLEWSLYFTATDVSSALTAGLGGFMAAKFGFENLFLIVGLISLIGTLFLTGIAGNLEYRRHRHK